MKITELLDLKGIELGVKVNSKDEAIDHLVDLMYATGKISDKAAYKKGILARESLTSTGIGEGIAIPHAQVAAVKRAGLAAMTVPDGVDYDSLDGQPAKLFFMIAAPEDGGNTHLQALAKLSALLMDEGFRQSLMEAKTPEEFLYNIDKKEAEKDAEDAAEAAKPQEGGYRILAVTACPTGIAHTYMAAENLTKAGDKLGYPLKAETNGSEGVKNRLTADEIAAADGIIVAADKNVEMARFDGKPVLQVGVTEGVRHPEELIKRLENGEAPIYHASEGEKSAASSGSVGSSFYKDLMNGVSNMLPFVVAGGILIALSFLVDTKGNGTSSFGNGTPLAAWFNQIGNLAFGMMLPVLSGYIAASIADRPGLAVGFVGGLLAKNGATFLDPSAAKVTAVPGFLGALLYGFLAGYIVNFLKKLFSGMPKSLDGIKPVLLYPLFGVAIMAVIACAINPFIGLINKGLSNFLNGLGNYGVILGIVAGGMMAIDMGGPFNKAAYVTATGLLASGNYILMAAVMAGGMVPPLAIALSTTFFKNKWTEEERNAGIVNYVMGLSFITEGAIPFAAKDPGHVIPSMVVGSALAGGLSVLFNCTLRAPHGGIFVIATIGNWPMYLLSIAAGAVVGCLILSFWKKPLDK
jgi:PTS system fructose-specific IIC component